VRISQGDKGKQIACPDNLMMDMLAKDNLVLNTELKATKQKSIGIQVVLCRGVLQRRADIKVCSESELWPFQPPELN